MSFILLIIEGSFGNSFGLSNSSCDGLCPMNTYSLAGASICTSCAVGTSSLSGSSVCDISSSNSGSSGFIFDLLDPSNIKQFVPLVIGLFVFLSLLFYCFVRWRKRKQSIIDTPNNAVGEDPTSHSNSSISTNQVILTSPICGEVSNRSIIGAHATLSRSSSRTGSHVLSQSYCLESQTTYPICHAISYSNSSVTPYLHRRFEVTRILVPD